MGFVKNFGLCHDQILYVDYLNFQILPISTLWSVMKKIQAFSPIVLHTNRSDRIVMPLAIEMAFEKTKPHIHICTNLGPGFCPRNEYNF